MFRAAVCILLAAIFAGAETLAGFLPLGPSSKALLEMSGESLSQESDPDLAPKIPFLENAENFLAGGESEGEGSEPEDFDESAEDLAENSAEDFTDSTESAGKISDTLFIDMRFAAVPLESGRVTSPYGFRHYRIHKGIDIGLKKGDSIRAAFAGTVTRVRYERRGYGKYIVLHHEGGITRTVYAHLSKQLVKVGQTVEAGDVIGLGGSTGRSTGPHLHFEARIGEIPVDPRLLFDFPNHAPADSQIVRSMETVQADYAALEKEASKHRFHKIRPGDTLGKIARKYHTSIQRLCQLNGIKRNSILRVGRMLRCS